MISARRAASRSLFTAGCAKKQEAEVEAPAPVQVTAVTQDTIRRIVTGDGVLFPVDQSNVMPKITAPVQKFLVNRGDHVKKDQLLAVLENRDLVAAVAANKGQVDQAEANLHSTEQATIPESVVKAQTDVESDQEQFDAAKKVLESRQKLFEQGALAAQVVDDAGVQYAAGQGATGNRQGTFADAAGGRASRPRSTAPRRRWRRPRRSCDRPKRRWHTPRSTVPARRGGRPSAVRRRNGGRRHASAHRHGHLPRGGARQRSARRTRSASRSASPPPSPWPIAARRCRAR